MKSDLEKSDLPALILAVLNRQSLHGYGIAREVEKLDNQILRQQEGLVYPALRLLEQDGLVEGKWTPQESGADRRMYQLTEKGKRAMAHRAKERNDHANRKHALLRRNGHAQPA